MAPNAAVFGLAFTALVLLSAISTCEAVKAVAVTRDHPIEGVIDLLKHLEATAEKDQKEEEVLYAKFVHWCQTSQQTLDKAITAEKAQMEKLSSEIEAHEKNIEVLTKEIADLGDKLLELENADIAASNDRAAGEGLYKAEHESLLATISAIGKAIEELEMAKGSVGKWMQVSQRIRSVLALVSYRATKAQREVLQNFKPEDRPELKAEGDYEDHIQKYDFKSQKVIELLKELKLKFEDEDVAATKAETNALNAYELAKQARGDVRTASSATKGVKEGERDGAIGDLSLAQSDYNNTRDDLIADSATLGTTKETCGLKHTEWEERSATRGKEREAIETAIAILAKVTGVRTEAPSNPVPPTSPVSLLQLSSPNSKRAVTLLRAEARTEHSKALEELASAVEKHGDGPFDQIVNMIQKMIFRLMNEQKEEDEHKDWCDQALSKTDKSIEDKKDKIEELTAKIDDAGAQAESLLINMNEADNMVSKITAHMKEATEIREIGKKENAEAIKDAEDAQTALANAIAVLKDHYKESGEVPKESWEFIQSRREPVTLPEEPFAWDASYTAVADPTQQPRGILTLLEKVSADFAHMESDTAAQEASDKEIFDEDMKNCDVERARRSKESEVKDHERKRQLEKQASFEKERKGVKGELEATQQYFSDLQPACVTGDSTYEDRKAARSKEVDALKEAQGLLQNAFEDNATKTAQEPAEGSALKFLGRRTLRTA